MPAPEENLIVAPRTTAITVTLEPVHNALHNMMLLLKAENLSGLGEWVLQTLEQMTPEELERHWTIVIGCYFALQSSERFASFPEYLEHLESLPAMEFQDRLFHAYSRIPPRVGGEYQEMGEDPLPIDRQQALSSAEAYLDFLRERFPPDHLDEDVEYRAYELVSNPDRMKESIISHLRQMWERYLEPEWRRNEPMLRDAVEAFSRVDFESMTRLEAARFITGQALEEERWESMLEEAQEVIFVPSAQSGPYLGRFWCGNGVIGIIFGARLPPGTDIQAPDLSRTEIVVRLSALADDTRLRILKLIAEEGEQRSQAIIDRLELSQSAASRHLKQLSATGYLSERRCAGAKCYRLNPERIEDTLDAVASFLIG